MVLAVGELASNSCTHASGLHIGGMLTVDSRMIDGAVHVTVADEGRWRTPVDRGGGRGLKIVRAVVDSLTIDSTDQGTRVSFVRTLGGRGIDAA